ncbi:MAG: hypothetical protein JNG86_11535, partial [Verrucomicrobiaceae bacterium]|nr:hypothetical protein [Verrucomicrobiaceae bacterium]
HHQLENAIGSRPREEGVLWEQKLPLGTQRWLYRFALERGYLDSMLEKWVARPFVALFRGLDAVETKWAKRLDGEPKAKEAPRDL